MVDFRCKLVQILMPNISQNQLYANLRMTKFSYISGMMNIYQKK